MRYPHQSLFIFTPMSNGFVKYNRSDSAKNLESRPNENHLLSVIARRVSRCGNPVKGVEIGEALIGDYENLGLKRQPYRTAITNLKKWGYVTTRVTNRITYARLCSTDVYDCNVFEANQPANPNPTTKPTTEQPEANQPLTIIKKERIKEEEERKNKRSKDIVIFLEIANYFKSVTGRDIRLGSTDSKIMASDKYKTINARIVQGASVEDCKLVIDFMFKKWKNNKEMQDYIRISTFFGFKNFEKYLDSALNQKGVSAAPKKFPYALPNFESKQERQDYFLARYVSYKPHLDEYKKNTEYRQRAIYQQDAESLCFELELEMPNLLDADFKYHKL